MAWKSFSLAAFALVAGTAAFSDAANATGENSTTISATKTIDVCKRADGDWEYSGVVSVANGGSVWTGGLAIEDYIQRKVGTDWQDLVGSSNINIWNTEVGPGGEVAFTYRFAGPSAFAYLDGGLRNRALVTILNYSGSIGTPKGAEAKATWAGGTPPLCKEKGGGCAYTQGYWKAKPDVIWPDPYSRGATFYQSGKTWQGQFDTPVKGNQYWNLSHQFAAATLNQASGAFVPAGVQGILDLAGAWFAANTPASCPKGGSCAEQNSWAGILDSYNNGLYPGGPAHCGD